MADEKKPTQEQSGPFQLVRKFDEVGLEVGHFYESRHVPSGRPAVTLRPGDRVYWLHRGPWKLLLSCEADSPDVSLTVQEAPPFAPPTQVMDMLTLMSSAFRRAEDSPRLLAHFAGGPVRARPWRQLPRMLAGVAVLVLGVGLGWWLSRANAPSAGPCPMAEATLDAPALIDSAELPISYPLPSQPFRNQAKTPCKTQLFEVEINGGCWVALEQKPPCAAVRAEYEGKCYLPVSKDRGLPPQSTHP